MNTTDTTDTTEYDPRLMAMIKAESDARKRSNDFAQLYKTSKRASDRRNEAYWDGRASGIAKAIDILSRDW
jgi:hypothetical protein